MSYVLKTYFNRSTMKNILFTLCALMLIASCGPKDPEAEKMALLSEKKATVSKKKGEVRELQGEIEKLKKESQN